MKNSYLPGDPNINFRQATNRCRGPHWIDRTHCPLNKVFPDLFSNRTPAGASPAHYVSPAHNDAAGR